MLTRAGVVWLAIMIAAILNGAFRDVVLLPRFGDTLARALSCLTLAAIILFVTWLSLQWIHPDSRRDAWTIGTLWLGMTLAFEFGAGHYLFGTPWPQLAADYNLLAGRLWILVLMTTLAAPPLVYAVGQNPTPNMEIPSPASNKLSRP
jgi:hypothetical protein